ncbi:MAG: hypothetical protein IH987_22620, partial [Planctomycetes bacterium]|nr:hypothetical protein [Planctomycetota bacterium]
MNRITLASVGVVAGLLLVPENTFAVGGDDCVTATVIAALPYNDFGNTCAPTNNWYDEHCPAHSASSEVVYTYIAQVDECVNVGLCAPITDFDTKLYVYEGVCPQPGSDNTGSQIACNDDACPPPVPL